MPGLMADSRVIVVLGRDEADSLTAGRYMETGELPAYARSQAKIKVALDRDPDELIEQVAEAIDPGAFTTRPGSPNVFVFSESERRRARDRARAALRAIEGADQ